MARFCLLGGTTAAGDIGMAGFLIFPEISFHEPVSAFLYNTFFLSCFSFFFCSLVFLFFLSFFATGFCGFCRKRFLCGTLGGFSSSSSSGSCGAALALLFVVSAGSLYTLINSATVDVFSFNKRSPLMGSSSERHNCGMNTIARFSGVILVDV